MILNSIVRWLVAWCLRRVQQYLCYKSLLPVQLSMLPGILFPVLPHNILSKPLAAFLNNHCQNNGQRWERNEFIRIDYHQFSEKLSADSEIKPATSRSQVLYATNWALGLCSILFNWDFLSIGHPGSWLVQCLVNLEYRLVFSPFATKFYKPFSKLTLFQTSPGFYWRVCSTSLLKTLRAKDKLLLTSNFSFSHIVFYPFWRAFWQFTWNLKLSSANSLSLEESKICRLGKG